MPDVTTPSPAQTETRPAAQEAVPATAAEESTGVFRIIVLCGLALIVSGWFLPWYVGETTNGIGYSPMDAVLSFTGIGTVLIYLNGAAMLALIAGLVDDFIRRRRGLDPRFSGGRALLSVAGAISTAAIAILVGVVHEEPLFGVLTQYSFTDNAVWMTLTGFALCAFGYGFKPWIIRHPSIAFTAVAFAIGATFPLIFNEAGDFVGWGARFAAVYILLALGLNVVVGFAGLLDLGYAAFFAIGAYTAASLAGQRYGLHLPFIFIIFLGAAIAGVFGAVLGAPTLRLRGDYLAIVTLGFGEIIPDLATNNVFGATGGPNGLAADPAKFGGFNLGQLGAVPANTKFYFWLLLILVALIVVALRNIERSRLGRAWVAIREDEVAAAATGINTVSTKLLAFSIGACVSGFAGAFFGAMLGTVTPDNFQFAVSVTVLSTVVLGGIGNIAGVAVGAVVIAFVINWIIPNAQQWMGTLGTNTGLTQLGNFNVSQYVYILYGLILIGIMLLRPAGLLPSKARKVELTRGGAVELLAEVEAS